MATEEVGIRLSLKGRREVAKGLRDTSQDVGKVETSLDRVGRAGRRASDGIDRVARAGANLGRVGAGVAVAGVAAAGFALSRFVSDAAESARITRLTEAAIRSTGGAANITAEQVGSLAESISNKTAIDDEAIQGASNLLLTFTKVRNEVGKGNDIFDQATLAAANMSAALGTDISGAALQLGKALNDPIKGVSALGRAGVSFTKQQKDQIRTLVDSGKTLQAQRIILAELGVQFGGAAEAAADPMQRLSVIAGNLGERVGTILLPHVERFSTFLIDRAVPVADQFFGEFERGEGAGGRLRDRIGELAAGAVVLWSEFRTGVGTGGEIRGALEGVGQAALVVGEIARDVIVPALSWLNDHPDALKGIVTGMVALRVATWGAVTAQLALNAAQAASPGPGGVGGIGIPKWLKTAGKWAWKGARVATPLGATLAVGSAINSADEALTPNGAQPGLGLAGPAGQPTLSQPTLVGFPPQVRRDPAPAPTPVPAPRSGDDRRQIIQNHHHIYIDGKQVTDVVVDSVHAQEARR
jgi:hypothetical protein